MDPDSPGFHSTNETTRGHGRRVVFCLRGILIAAILFTAFLSTRAQIVPGNMTGYSTGSRSVVLRADTVSLRITFYQPDIVRVDYLPAAYSVPDSSFVVIRDSSADVSISVTDSDSSISIASGGISINCRKYPLRLSFAVPGRAPFLSEPDAGGAQSDGASRTIRFLFDPSSHWYGTGERGTPIDKSGQAFDSWNQAHFGYSGPLATMNINIPFAASPGGLAIYIDNTWPGHFDIGASAPGVFSYSAGGGELTYYIIAGPTLPAQLERYTWLTGRQPLPPRWALGYIQSKFGYRNAAEAQAMVQSMRQKQIPCDAIVLDLYWFQNMGDLTWNTADWPDPYGMMGTFLSQGFRTITITEPYVVQYSQNYAAASGYAVRNRSGQPFPLSNWWSCGCSALLVDFTDPAARAWWWNKYPQFMMGRLGGFWTDLGEPERDSSSMVYALGPSDRFHNIYNFLWARTLDSGYRTLRPNERILNLTRSGFAGIQRFGAIPWSGDVGKSFGGLAVQIPMLLNMGMSGLAYLNSDIGGFTGTGTGELYARWMQYGAFCPMMRAHGVGHATEPWSWGATVEAIAKQYITLRYSLLPYNYTTAWQNYRSGMPLARPLFFEDPTDNRLFSDGSDYLWGDDILVHPVTVSTQDPTSVLLPSGGWIDYWTDSLFIGGGTVQVPTPMDRMPVFIRSGSIIPMQLPMNYSDERPLDTLFLHVYPDPAAVALDTLYEDDGKSLGYQNGEFSVTPFSAATRLTGDTASGNVLLTLTIGGSAGSYAGKPAIRTWIPVIHTMAGRPGTVTMNGRVLPSADSAGGIPGDSGGYWYDSLQRRLMIVVRTSADSSSIITVSISATGVRQHQDLPAGFSMDPVYPNPFNPSATVQFTLPDREYVTGLVTDLLGRTVLNFLHSTLPAGKHRYAINASGLPQGAYFVLLRTARTTAVRKVILLK